MKGHALGDGRSLRGSELVVAGVEELLSVGFDKVAVCADEGADFVGLDGGVFIGGEGGEIEITLAPHKMRIGIIIIS